MNRPQGHVHMQGPVDSEGHVDIPVRVDMRWPCGQVPITVYIRKCDLFTGHIVLLSCSKDT